MPGISNGIGLRIVWLEMVTFWDLFLDCSLGDCRSLDTIRGFSHCIILLGKIGIRLCLAVQSQFLVLGSASGTLTWGQSVTLG